MYLASRLLFIHHKSYRSPLTSKVQGGVARAAHPSPVQDGHFALRNILFKVQGKETWRKYDIAS